MGFAALHEDAQEVVNFLISQGAWLLKLDLTTNAEMSILTRNYRVNFEDNALQGFNFWFGSGNEGDSIRSPLAGMFIQSAFNGILVRNEVSILYLSSVIISPSPPDDLDVYWRKLVKWADRRFVKRPTNADQKPYLAMRTHYYLCSAAEKWVSGPGHYIVGEWESPPIKLQSTYPQPREGRDVVG